MIKFRIDVDYPYPSRMKSFICTATGIRFQKDYLKNPKIIARMINESNEQIRAIWFFTPATVPNKEILQLLGNEKHEIGVHIVNRPCQELKRLDEATGRKARYYTMHGVDRFLARIIWKRWRNPQVPPNFPLQDYKDLPLKGYGLDRLCYDYPQGKVVDVAREYIQKGYILHLHPEWLFSRGKINRRGRFYEVLQKILKVDNELETISFRKKLFFTITRDWKEYEKDVIPSPSLINKIQERGSDTFTFLERKWCSIIPNPQKSWAKTSDNIAFLDLKSYDEWWKTVGKKTRNMIRKAEKSGIRTGIAEPNENLVKGMWKIYNETPIRQERAFPHYGIALEAVARGLASTEDALYIVAYLQDELVGFVQLINGDRVVVISQILSMQKHLDKAVNNALVAKTIEVCASKGLKWIMYGRIGNHPSLDKFKQSNGFTQFELTRYYMPLTKKGRIAIRFGLQREIKDRLPKAIKYPLFPVYNWVSRTRARIRLISMQKPPR